MSDGACRGCGVATKKEYVEILELEYVEILEFTHFVEFFSFRKIGENHKEKSLVKKVTVVVALDLGTGNTKNLEMFLASGYRVERCVCVDQFAQTVHVETVVRLQRIDT